MTDTTQALNEREAELERENSELRAALVDKAKAETMLRELSVSNGGINMSLEGGMCHLLAETFADQFREKGGANYLEMGFTTKDGLRLVVTLQRADGKTPGQLKAEADKRAAELEAQLQEARALLSAPAVPQWISVKERLPECIYENEDTGLISKTVMLSGPGCSLGFGHLQAGGQWIVYEGEFDQMMPSPVTHWMPLPTAPAAGGGKL